MQILFARTLNRNMRITYYFLALCVIIIHVQHIAYASMKRKPDLTKFSNKEQQCDIAEKDKQQPQMSEQNGSKNEAPAMEIKENAEIPKATTSPAGKQDIHEATGVHGTTEIKSKEEKTVKENETKTKEKTTKNNEPKAEEEKTAKDNEPKAEEEKTAKDSETKERERTEKKQMEAEEPNSATTEKSQRFSPLQLLLCVGLLIIGQIIESLPKEELGELEPQVNQTVGHSQDLTTDDSQTKSTEVPTQTEQLVHTDWSIGREDSYDDGDESAEEDISPVPASPVVQERHTNGKTVYLPTADRDSKAVALFYKLLDFIAHFYDTELDVQPLTHKNQVPAILPCVGASRLGSDVSASFAKSKLPDGCVPMLILIHPRAPQNSRVFPTRQKGSDFLKDVDGVFDFVVWDDKIYDCDQNDKAVQELMDFIDRM